MSSEKRHLGIVEQYCQRLLRPQLHSLGLSHLQIHLIAEDVSLRLESLLANWENARFRRTALFPALEVAEAYGPEAPLEIKALVVSGVRNSMLTELNATRSSSPIFDDVAGCLADEKVPQITGSAIKFFAERWNGRSGISIRGRDLFRELASQYPCVWRRLEALAHSTRQELRLELEEMAAVDLPLTDDKPDGKFVVESGYATYFHSQELAILNACRSNPDGMLFAPVFKMISRNPEKVLNVINMVISWNLPFVTLNYVISRDYCARRKKLSPAPHDPDDVRRAVRDFKGLTATHAALMKRVSA